MELHSALVISTINGCVSISGFGSLLVGIPLGIVSSGIGLKLCAVTAGIKKYELIIKEKKKKQNKIVLLRISKLINIEVLISKALMKSNISHDKFVSINVVLKEFHDMKEEIKNSNDNIKVYYLNKTMLSYCLKCRKNTESLTQKLQRLKTKAKCPVCNSKKSKFC